METAASTAAVAGQTHVAQRLGVHLRDERLGGRPVDLLHRAEARPRDDADRGGEAEPDRRPDPGSRHDEHLGGAEPPAESRGVHRARAPEGDDPEPSRVLALRHRVEARGARHLLDDDVVDRHRRVLDRAPEGRRDLAFDGLPGESRGRGGDRSRPPPPPPR